MRLRTATAALLAVALLAAGRAAPAAAAERALWTWEAAAYAMLEDRAAADAALDFVAAKRVDTLYLYADAYDGRNLLADQPALYRALLRRLHRAGLRSYALLGSAYLHTEAYVLPEHHADAAAMLGRVLDFNAAAAPDERFDGINVDVEPHLLDAWDEHRLELLGQYLDLASELMALKRASGQALEIGPALPFWFDGIVLTWHGRSASVAEHALTLYDYAALMDYRDHAAGADGIISHAAGTLALADRLHKRLLIGVEVSPNDIEKVSFQHLAEPDLERELARTAAALGGHPAFAGFAIHHYATYRDWAGAGRPRRGPPAQRRSQAQ